MLHSRWKNSFFKLKHLFKPDKGKKAHPNDYFPDIIYLNLDTLKIQTSLKTFKNLIVSLFTLIGNSNVEL